MLMKKIKLLLASALVLVSSAFAFAQNIKVSGNVVDQSGAPLIGATVMLQGSTSVGTSTDIEGAYSLNVPSNGTLVVTMVGYADQTARVN